MIPEDLSVPDWIAIERSGIIPENSGKRLVNLSSAVDISTLRDMLCVDDQVRFFY